MLIKSGIPGFDNIMGGGLLQGSIITVGGPTGSGRSTFAMQFLIESNEPGLYISIEESKKELFFHMSGYSWDMQKLEQESKLVILDYPIYEVDQILNQYSAIQEIIQTTGVKRVVIDSIMPIALYFKTDEERKKGFLKLIENIRKWEVTTIIVAHDPDPSEQSILPNTTYNIESFTDGWIHLFFGYDEKQGKRTRSIEVIKMKGMPHSTKRYPAKIDNNGFSIILPEQNEQVRRIVENVVKKIETPKIEVQKIEEKKPLHAEEAKKKLLGIRRKK